MLGFGVSYIRDLTVHSKVYHIPYALLYLLWINAGQFYVMLGLTDSNWVILSRNVKH